MALSWIIAVSYTHLDVYKRQAYANERDILIIGDLPIYVSRDSVEMWATPELFKIDVYKRQFQVYAQSLESIATDPLPR